MYETPFWSFSTYWFKDFKKTLKKKTKEMSGSVRERWIRHIIHRAASVNRDVMTRRMYLQAGKWKAGCRNYNEDREKEVSDPKLPIVDLLTSEDIEKSDIVVLSDGNCYSRKSMLEMISHEPQVRPKLWTQRPMLDLDYALLGRIPPSHEKIVQDEEYEAQTQEEWADMAAHSDDFAQPIQEEIEQPRQQRGDEEEYVEPPRISVDVISRGGKPCQDECRVNPSRDAVERTCYTGWHLRSGYIPSNWDYC